VLDWSTGICNRVDITQDTTTLYASDRTSPSSWSTISIGSKPVGAPMGRPTSTSVICTAGIPNSARRHSAWQCFQISW